MFRSVTRLFFFAVYGELNSLPTYNLSCRYTKASNIKTPPDSSPCKNPYLRNIINVVRESR